MFPDKLIQHPTRRTTHIGRPKRMSDGQLVAFIARFYRDDPEQGIWNPDTTGVAEMDLMVARSTDDGSTWGEPHAHLTTSGRANPLKSVITIVELVQMVDGWLRCHACGVGTEQLPTV